MYFSSSLPEVLPDHINAEIVSGTITSKQEAMDYITWTYFFRRLLMNPSYYNLESMEHDEVNKYLSSVVQDCIGELNKSYCLEIDEVSIVLVYQMLVLLTTWTLSVS